MFSPKTPYEKTKERAGIADKTPKNYKPSGVNIAISWSCLVESKSTTVKKNLTEKRLLGRFAYKMERHDKSFR